MNGKYTWREAWDSYEGLPEIDRDLFWLVARLPLVTIQVLALFLNARPISVRHRLAHLRTAGVVEAVKASPEGRPSQLHFLSGLGLGVTAVIGRADNALPTRICWPMEADPAWLLWRLPQLHAVYQLLASIGRSRPIPVSLLDWQRPWRRRFQTSIGSTMSVALPAYAALTWADGSSGDFLLLPDHGVVPVAAYRPLLTSLFRLRAVDEDQQPLLVVATQTSQRALVWDAILKEVSSTLGEAPLAVSIRVGKRSPGPVAATRSGPISETCARRAYGPIDGLWTASRRPGQYRFPPLSTTGGAGRGTPDFVGLGLTIRDLALLELIGRHPFLSMPEVEALQGRSARDRCQRLWAHHLIGAVPFPSRLEQVHHGRTPGAINGVGSLATLGLELTGTGLEILATNHGLPAYLMGKHLGLAASGGPRSVVKCRRQLLRTLDHTRAVNRLYVRWMKDCGRRQAHGWDDTVVRWLPAAACGGPLVRPDAFLVYRRAGQRHGAFVEYDRGTERKREYRRKFRAYWEFHDTRAYRRDYDGFPTVLMVAVDKQAEDRIVKVLIGMGFGRSNLPLLISNEQRIKDDPAGLLGYVWRGSEPTFSARCDWPDRRVRSLAALAAS